MDPMISAKGMSSLMDKDTGLSPRLLAMKISASMRLTSNIFDNRLGSFPYDSGTALTGAVFSSFHFSEPQDGHFVTMFFLELFQDAPHNLHLSTRTFTSHLGQRVLLLLLFFIRTPPHLGHTIFSISSFHLADLHFGHLTGLSLRDFHSPPHLLHLHSNTDSFHFEVWHRGHLADFLLLLTQSCPHFMQ